MCIIGVISDETKVGQRLLEKMGWSKGKALGLKEDGCKEHVKVSTKIDRKGTDLKTFVCSFSHIKLIVASFSCQL